MLLGTCKLKQLIQYYFIPTRMAKIQNTVMLCIRQDWGDTGMNKLQALPLRRSQSERIQRVYNVHP